jgi:hypothetical protein
VRHGNGGKRREVSMDSWAWDQLAPWLRRRTTLPVGALCCASSRARHAGAHRRHRRPANRSVGSRGPPVCAGGSPCTSCVTRPKSRWPERACRWWSSSVRWGMQPGDHLGLPAGHRERRDHRYRPRPPRTHDPRQRRAPNDAVATSVVARHPTGPLAAWPQARESRSGRRLHARSDPLGQRKRQRLHAGCQRRMP